jgi:hypothetical protein
MLLFWIPDPDSGQALQTTELKTRLLIFVAIFPFSGVLSWVLIRNWLQQCCGYESAWVRVILGRRIRIKVESWIQVRIKVKRCRRWRVILEH